MIRRLQYKIIAVILGTLLIVFAAVLLVLNLTVYQTSVKQAEDFMASVAENDGFLFPPMSRPGSGPPDRGRAPFGSPQMMRAGRFFYAKLDPDGHIAELNLEMMFDFSRSEAESVVSAVYESGQTKGDRDNFRFLSAEKPYGCILVFAERSIEMGLLDNLTRASLWAAGVASLILVCLAAFLAQWMVRPVKSAFDKQRRFVSDASHELKTPLTIIGANLDVLQNDIGENQWITHSKTQMERMNALIHSLLLLAGTDEGQTGRMAGEFSLSSAVLSVALEFESLAFEEGKKYEYHVMDNIYYNGNKMQIRQLVSILLDNAIRYSDANGQIDVSLNADNGHKHISVFNTGVGVPNNERDRIFERFYRIDESRTRETGGYGIGLSLAEAIAHAHKGKITVSGDYGKWIRFDLTL